LVVKGPSFKSKEDVKMKRRNRVRAGGFLALLLAATMLFSTVAPPLAEASIWKRIETASVRQQVLSDDEMKEVVGGKKVLKKLFTTKFYGEIYNAPKGTTSVLVKVTGYTGPVAGSWCIYDPAKDKGKYEAHVGGWPLVIAYIEAKAYDSGGRQAGDTWKLWWVGYGTKKVNVDISWN